MRPPLFLHVLAGVITAIIIIIIIIIRHYSV